VHRYMMFPILHSIMLKSVDHPVFHFVGELFSRL